MAGVITHPRTGRIIAVKPAPPKMVPVARARNIDAKAYAAEDGSVVTLYYAEDWYVTTYNANAHDVYMFGFSLGAIFNELIIDALGVDWGKRLDPSMCYSFCLSSYKIHRFQPDGYQKIWFIQSVDIARANAGEIIICRVSQIPEIPSQPEVEPNWEKLGSAFAHFCETGERLYGVLLRTPEATYMVESDLHKMVKNTLYQGGLNVKHGKTGRHLLLVLVGAYVRNDPLLPYIHHGEVVAIEAAFTGLIDRIYAKVKHPYIKDPTPLGSVATACYIALSEKHALSTYSDSDLMEILRAYCKSSAMIPALADLMTAA